MRMINTTLLIIHNVLMLCLVVWLLFMMIKDFPIEWFRRRSNNGIGC